MRKAFLLVINILCLSWAANAQTLGTYPASNVVVGHNITIAPSTGPGGSTVRLSAVSSTNFLGVITINPSNGRVTIINATPAGDFIVTVKAYNSSGSAVTRSFPLTVKNSNCSQANFISAADIHTGLNQISVVVGDFNGDNKQDIAAAHEGGNNTLSIRLGDGTGGFHGTTEVPVGSHPFNLAVGDFNSDGKQDIIIANSGANSVSYMMGNGAGGFSTYSISPVGNTPVNVKVGDFNGDGKQDFLAANLNSNSVSVRLGDGAGGFTGSTSIPVGPFPYCIAVGDFDNNGKQDFATANSGNNTVSIRMGNGSGGFTGTTSVSVGAYPYGVTVGDFDNDNVQDIATANYIGNSISIRLGDGQGGFSGTTEIPVGANPYFIAQGNFNGDHNEDLATANYFSNSVSIRFGNGAGGFLDTVELTVGAYPMSLIAGEFNNDSIMDLAVSNFMDASISIRLGVPGISVPEVILSNSPVCDGMSIDLLTNHGSDFSWTGPNGFTDTVQNLHIHPCALSDSGEYHIDMIDSASCPASMSTYVKINPRPFVSFSWPIDTLCSGAPVQLITGGFPLPGIYSGIGVYFNDQFDPALIGIGDFYIDYTYTDTNDCSNTATEKVTIDICLGVNDASVSGSMNVYPNPVADEFAIDLPFSTKKSLMMLYTPEGKLVREWRVDEDSENRFSMASMAEGIYILKLFSEDHSFITKIIKQ